MNDFRQHADLRDLAIDRASERLLGIALAVVIGFCLGMAAAEWWSA